jgi:hypothetical protein
MLRRTLRPAVRGADPDWAGFWPGIVRGIEDARGQNAPLVPAAVRKWWWNPRWALGGAALAVGILSFSLWQTMPDFLASEPPVVVSSAHTDDPNGTVMVYSGHGKGVTVVWVLGLEESSD